MCLGGLDGLPDPQSDGYVLLILLHPVLRAVHDELCLRFSTTGLAARSGLGDRGNGGSARSGLGDRGAGESACWSSKGRRRTARGGGIGGGRGGGRGGDGDGGHGPFTVAYNGDIVKALFLRS